MTLILKLLTFIWFVFRAPISPHLPSAPLAEPVCTNKLSSRWQCILTPPPKVIRDKEENFVLDSITTEKQQTKYKDIIPKYDAGNLFISLQYSNIILTVQYSNIILTVQYSNIILTVQYSNIILTVQNSSGN